MNTTRIMSVVTALSCAFVLAGCTADTPDNTSNASDSATVATSTTSDNISTTLSDAERGIVYGTLLAGYRGKEADDIITQRTQKPDAYEIYQDNRGDRFELIDNADKVMVGVLYSMFTTTHPSHGIPTGQLIDGRVSESSKGDTLPYAPDVRDAVINEFEKVYSDYRIRYEKCYDIPLVADDRVDWCQNRTKRDRINYMISLFRQLPDELTPFSGIVFKEDGMEVNYKRYTKISDIPDKDLYELLSYSPLATDEIDEQLGFDPL